MAPGTPTPPPFIVATPDVIGLSSIHFYGLVIETLLYGIYLVLAWISFWIMNERRREGNPVNKIIITCCVVIFFCTGIHWGGTVALVYEGLVTYGTNPTVGLALLYGNTTRVAIMRLAIYGLAGMAIDIMLIYRLWIVWGRAWKVIIVPVAFTAIGLVSTIMVVYFAATTAVGDVTPGLKIAISTSFTLHASTNIICTVMIVTRIFRNSASVSTNKSQLMSLVWVIIESAAIYTSLSLCLMGLLISEKPAALLFADIQPPMIGISSSLLIVRVAAASASRGSGANNTSRSLSRSLPNSDIRSAVAASSAPYGMGAGDVPLKVKVSVTHHHTHDHGTCDVDEDMDRKIVLGNGLDSNAGANAV